MFRNADLVLITKTDLLPLYRRLRPGARRGAIAPAAAAASA